MGPRKGDKDTATFINQTYQRAEAFLFGRRTYELFAGSWGSLPIEDVPGWEPVCSRRWTPGPSTWYRPPRRDPAWSGTTVPSGDLVTAIADLKGCRG